MCGPAQRHLPQVSSTSPVCSDSKTQNAGKLAPVPLFPSPSPRLSHHRLLESGPETLPLPLALHRHCPTGLHTIPSTHRWEPRNRIETTTAGPLSLLSVKSSRVAGVSPVLCLHSVI